MWLQRAPVLVPCVLSEPGHTQPAAPPPAEARPDRAGSLSVHTSFCAVILNKDNQNENIDDEVSNLLIIQNPSIPA